MPLISITIIFPTDIDNPIPAHYGIHNHKLEKTFFNGVVTTENCQVLITGPLYTPLRTTKFSGGWNSSNQASSETLMPLDWAMPSTTSTKARKRISFQLISVKSMGQFGCINFLVGIMHRPSNLYVDDSIKAQVIPLLDLSIFQRHNKKAILVAFSWSQKHPYYIRTNAPIQGCSAYIFLVLKTP